jgi:hypothetical protein
MRKSQTIAQLIRSNQTSNIDELSTDAQTLFGFLTLIIDIKYRHRYGKVIEEQRGKGYSS